MLDVAGGDGAFSWRTGQAAAVQFGTGQYVGYPYSSGPNNGTHITGAPKVCPAGQYIKAGDCVSTDVNFYQPSTG